MFELKKVQTISQASANIATLPLARPVKKVRRRPQPAFNVRNPRIVMGLIFLFLLIAYLVAYAQEAVSSPQPYLVIEPPETQVLAPASLGGDLELAAPEQPMLVPVTGQ